MKNNLCDARYGTIALLACLAFGPLFAAEPVPLVVPPDSAIPAGPEGEAVRLGPATDDRHPRATATQRRQRAELLKLPSGRRHAARRGSVRRD
jgi:hypothetical protein